jgi:hypothetical protein
VERLVDLAAWGAAPIGAVGAVPTGSGGYLVPDQAGEPTVGGEGGSVLRAHESLLSLFVYQLTQEYQMAIAGME